MKNLNDELKKLNVEYNVSNDFKNSVMKKIKEEEKDEPLNNFSIVLTKIAYAAAIIIVCMLFIDKPSTLDISNQSSMILNDGFQEYETTIDKNILEKSNVLSSDITNETFDKSITKDERILAEDNVANSVVATESRDIKDVIIQNNIVILEEKEDYIIVESEKEIIEELLENFEYQIEILDDGKIKIIFI